MSQVGILRKICQIQKTDINECQLKERMTLLVNECSLSAYYTQGPDEHQIMSAASGLDAPLTPIHFIFFRRQ